MNRKAHGFSITELLVASTLLATVLAGGLQAFTRAHQSRRESAVTQHLHERAQYSFATLEPELQMAGYFATAGRPAALPEAQIPPSAQQCGNSVVARIDEAVTVLPAWTLPCAARGGGAMTGSDILIVRRTSAHLASAAEPGRAQWFSDFTATASGRIFWRGDAAWTPAAVAEGMELRDLIVRIYYVAREADGESTLPALRVKSLTSIAGKPAFIDTEVMSGVEHMAVELVPTSIAPGAVQVALRIRANESAARDAASPRVLQVTRHFALRNVAR